MVLFNDFIQSQAFHLPITNDESIKNLSSDTTEVELSPVDFSIKNRPKEQSKHSYDKINVQSSSVSLDIDLAGKFFFSRRVKF